MSWLAPTRTWVVGCPVMARGYLVFKERVAGAIKKLSLHYKGKCCALFLM